MTYGISLQQLTYLHHRDSLQYHGRRKAFDRAELLRQREREMLPLSSCHIRCCVHDEPLIVGTIRMLPARYQPYPAYVSHISGMLRDPVND